MDVQDDQEVQPPANLPKDPEQGALRMALDKIDEKLNKRYRLTRNFDVDALTADRNADLDMDAAPALGR